MTVFALIYSVGISSGHKELIGLYDTKHGAVCAQRKNMDKFIYRMAGSYSIKEIQINTDINIVFAEW